VDTVPVTISSPAPTNKKVVVHIVSGRLTGLRRIVGHLVIGEEDIPPSFSHIEHGSVQHAGTFPRYVLYRQFNPTGIQKGQFSEFHPQQT
jgi:hypothetical protein